MSGPSPAGATPAQSKQISSRLLNMKFMQRAAAVDKTRSATSPQTPGYGPPLKRRRTGDLLPGASTPSTPGTPLSAVTRFNDAVFRTEGELASPASKARNHFDTNTFETEWVLDVSLPSGVDATTSTQQACGAGAYNDDEYSSSDGDVWGSAQPSGRQTFGSFKKKRTTEGVDSNISMTPTSLSKSARRNADRKDRDSGGGDRSRTSLGFDFLADRYSQSHSDEDSQNESGSNSGSQLDSDSDAQEDEHDSNDLSLSSSNRQTMKRKSSTTTKTTPSTSNHKKDKSHKKPGIDFLSDEYNQRIDRIDFSSPGLSTGLGKDRPGLSGGSSHHHPQNHRRRSGGVGNHNNNTTTSSSIPGLSGSRGTTKKVNKGGKSSRVRAKLVGQDIFDQHKKKG